VELLAVLPNPVDIESIRASHIDIQTQWSDPGPHLLAVGRLSREKGFDLLLDAFAKVREGFPTADLVIAGCGAEDASLKAHCDKLGLTDSVHFVGYVDHPEKYFPGASAFVLSSRHEGLPNALLEAVAVGLPIVALPSSDGVKNLLEDQPGVWLAPEVSADALAVTLLSAFEALVPNQRFEHAFVKQFSIDRAVPAYENLIDSCLDERVR
jgi:glycosyltransferase involved in cell wall biosynthesis